MKIRKGVVVFLITVSLVLLLSRTNGCKIKESGVQLDEEGDGEVSPALFWKQKKSALISQCPNFGKKWPVCVHLLLNSHLKCSFKSHLWQKIYFFPWKAFLLKHETYQTVPTPRNLPCPEKFQVACILI